MRAEGDPPPSITHFISRFRSEALQTGKMMIVGYDEGNSLRRFQQAGWSEIHAVDMDDRCLPKIQRQIDAGGVTAHVAKVQDLVLPSNLDVVELSHHLPSFLGGDLAATLVHAREATRPGGFVLGSAMAPGHSWEGREGLTVFTRDELVRQLKAAGYDSITISSRIQQNITADNGSQVENWHSWNFRARTPADAGAAGDGPPSA